ncbi:MAG: hypothetical protein ABWK01_02135 [Infirmifilum sp.]
MSIWSVYRVGIQQPRYDLLKQALEAVAARLGGTLKMQALVRGVRYPFAVHVEKWGISYAVTASGGSVVVAADDYKVPVDVSKFSEMLVEEYTRLAVEEAARAAGMRVESQRLPEGYVIRAIGARGAMDVAVNGNTVEVVGDDYEGDECIRDAEAIEKGAMATGLMLKVLEKRSLAHGLTPLGLSVKRVVSSPCG